MSGSAEDSEIEWEYEYDTAQTETIYVTVDLPIVRPPRVKGGHTSADKAKGNASEGDNDGYDDNDDDDDDDNDENDGDHRDTSRHGRAKSNATDDADDSDNSEESGRDGVSDRELLGEDSDDNHAPHNPSRQPKSASQQHCVQILDLPSENPMISYKGQVYSCDWGRTLGTDLVFAAPGVLDASVTPVMREKDYDLLSVTRVKLIGKAVILEPTDQIQSTGGKPQAQPDVSEPMPVSTQPDHDPREPSLVPSIDVEETKKFVPVLAANEAIPARPNDWDPKVDAYMVERNSWLQRFAELRHQKGEELKVPVRSGKQVVDFVPKIPGVTVPANDSNEKDQANGKSMPEPQDSHAMVIDTEEPDAGSAEEGPTPTPRNHGQGRVGKPRARGGGGRPRVRMPDSAIDALTGYGDYDSTDPASFSAQPIESEELYASDEGEEDTPGTPVRARGRGRGQPPTRRGQGRGKVNS